MENKKKLSHWLLNHYQNLDLKLTQFNWVEEWLPGFHDFELSITLGGRVFKGRGVGKNPRLAFTKAGSEALESAICNEYGVSSCGVAVHSNPKLARVKAQNELIERDRFFCHYLTHTPFQEITVDELNSRLKRIDFESIQRKLKFQSIDIAVFEMAPLNWTRSFICISKGDETGMILGFGSVSENYSIGIQTAIIECLLKTIAALYNKVFPLRAGRFIGEDFHHSNEKRRLYLSKNDLSSENQWLFSGRQSPNHIEFLDPKGFHYLNLISNHHILKEAPIWTARCYNPYLQQSFYGDTNPKKIKLQRLRQFLGKPMQITQVPNTLK